MPSRGGVPRKGRPPMNGDLKDPSLAAGGQICYRSHHCGGMLYLHPTSIMARRNWKATGLFHALLMFGLARVLGAVTLDAPRQNAEAWFEAWKRSSDVFLLHGLLLVV